MPNEAVLYYTHLLNPVIRGEIARMRVQLPGFAHWIIGYLKHSAPSLQQHRPDRIMYRRADLSALPYPKKIAKANWDQPAGNNDLPILAFYRDHPGYDFYWLIEYDVRYTGSWSDLFAELGRSSADLLATTIQDHDENPGWYWWPSLIDLPDRPLPRTRAFLPFCRLSNRALAVIDRWYSEGGTGHYELTWPSVCRWVGLTIEDIGSSGRYTPAERKGKHYFNSPNKASLSPGTFVFRPAFKHEVIRTRGLEHARGRPMLWHPIKA